MEWAGKTNDTNEQTPAVSTIFWIQCRLGLTDAISSTNGAAVDQDLQ